MTTPSEMATWILVTDLSDKIRLCIPYCTDNLQPRSYHGYYNLELHTHCDVLNTRIPSILDSICKLPLHILHYCCTTLDMYLGDKNS